ncbi:MAG: hypothetical protein ABJF23_14595 [Bryobacteraceae bacterium]
MSEPPNDPNAPLQATLVKPTAEQAGRGLANLEACLPYWKETPGLLVIKPELILVIAVVGSEHDHDGFRLRLAIQEVLQSPPGFAKKETDIGCIWNQPYMSFTKASINAPYCFYLNFGAAGVDKAREICKSTADWPGLGILLSGFK